jgi:hypothetical protein
MEMVGGNVLGTVSGGQIHGFTAWTLCKWLRMEKNRKNGIWYIMVECQFLKPNKLLEIKPVI